MTTLTPSVRLNSGQREAGFTVTELLIAVVVLGLLSSIAVPAFFDSIENARIEVAIGEMTQIDGALERFRGNNNGALPDSLAEVGMDSLTDPWGNAYQYLNIEAGPPPGQLRKDRNLVPLNTDFDLYSLGKDGESVSPLTSALSRDDIVRAGNGGFVGRAEDF